MSRPGKSNQHTAVACKLCGTPTTAKERQRQYWRKAQKRSRKQRAAR